MKQTITLYKKNDALHAHADGKEDQAVELVWLRPLSARGREFSIRGEKEEFAFVQNLDELDPASRALAEESLKKFYLMPEITRVIETHAAFGTRYWQVETEHGSREFAMKNPFVNIRYIGEDELIIRDVIDNRYHITSLASLDQRSREEIDKVT